MIYLHSHWTVEQQLQLPQPKTWSQIQTLCFFQLSCHKSPTNNNNNFSTFNQSGFFTFKHSLFVLFWEVNKTKKKTHISFSPHIHRYCKKEKLGIYISIVPQPFQHFQHLQTSRWVEHYPHWKEDYPRVWDQVQSQARLHHSRVEGEGGRANGQNHQDILLTMDLWINILWKGKGSRGMGLWLRVITVCCLFSIKLLIWTKFQA